MEDAELGGLGDSEMGRVRSEVLGDEISLFRVTGRRLCLPRSLHPGQRRSHAGPERSEEYQPMA